MEVLVEARQLSAVSPSGMLFTAVNAAVCSGDVAVISGPAGIGRTALLLALSGRFSTSGGTLRASEGIQTDAAQLRRRITVAQALPAIRTEPTLRISEAIAERCIIGGRKTVTVQTVWDALAVMGSEPPPLKALVQDMGLVEQVLFGLALARAQQADGICFDDVDGGLAQADRQFVREAVRSLAAAGPALIVTSCDPGWGTIDIVLSSQPGQSAATAWSGTPLTPSMAPEPAEPKARADTAGPEPAESKTQPHTADAGLAPEEGAEERCPDADDEGETRQGTDGASG
ncbi:ATP-binding cassette domain-containing protein [Streptomyces sp. NPDC058272]|uniref:ATP-binding cassette domain-containing protein n=1 Tax=Streptomyces sp. NPDC058272 TaxID=3346415 RepID=UPI0036EC1375